MNTVSNSFAESLEKLARDIQYPPMNGGPTQDEIISSLRAAADIIDEYEEADDALEEANERAEELEELIKEALDDLQECIEHERYTIEVECWDEDQLIRLTAIQDKLRRA